MLKATIEKLKIELDQSKKTQNMELQHQKLVSETERLNLKSEFEVKVEIISKENHFLQEERK